VHQQQCKEHGSLQKLTFNIPGDQQGEVDKNRKKD